ncbi:MAG: hypothetical protein JSW11_12250 [Candidatus Heimdallarchaeota archaeon]|nr:MAG: hypothetical protein JSW11_12250 [Candidatus Heimdallarchaeota archaeon]
MGFTFDIRGRFESFIEDFADEEGQLRYQEKIREMETMGARSLYISYNDLLIQDPKLAKEILVNPEVSIIAGEEILKSKITEMSPGYLERLKQVHVRITDLSERLMLRSLKTEHLDILTCFEGIVIGVTEAKPLMISAHFRCASCGENQIVDFPEGIYIPPYQCRNEQCQRKGSLQLQLDRSVFIDWQKITLQEKPEELPPGQLPQSTSIHVLDDLVDHARPGDRVEIVGILKARATRLLKRGQLATYGKFFHGVSISRETEEYVDIQISEEDELKIIDLSKSPYIIEKIRDSLAPSIYGHDLVKEAIASLLFGGTPKETPDGMKLRGESNILIVGDPGTGKSQILKFVSQLAPRALYTTGKGSTAAGLTAAVIRDQDTGEITLEAGALVLADQGIAMVDEFDKMRAEDRAAIHEAMEQHSYHPSFEITFSNGKKYPIGQFVDNLFDSNKEKVINGTNCEILPLQSDNNTVGTLLSTDFDSIFPLKPSHVSRHNAPNYFIKIKYSNGREITVTPEHPIFVFSGEYVDEVSAEEVKEKVFIPAVRMVNFQTDESLYSSIDQGRKKVRLPSKMEIPLARFLGYFVAEGYSYEGSSLEVGLSNTDPKITLDMKKCILETFNVEPIDNIKQGRVLRIISKSVFNYMQKNFSELMKKSLEKSIPHKIFSSGEDKKIAFLNTAFHGDGAIESEAAAYSTSSKKLAEDYQDLLLSLGIQTRIISSEYLTPKSKQRRTRYKVYIRGDSLKSFSELIIPEVNHQKIKYLLKRSLKTRGHDVLPSGVGHIIKRCMKKLGIPYNGYFQQAFKENCGIIIPVIDRYLDLLNTRINELKNEITYVTNIQEFRHITNYSQQRIGQITGNGRGSIDYIERGGYVLERRNQVLLQAKEAFTEEIKNVQKALLYIEKLKQFRWLRVNEIRRIRNTGQNKTNWVYDVTVSPTQTFINQGIVLHNTISIAKAGIVATLNARTSILAAANPRRGRWNPFKATADNLNLPPTILSRFDLIFVLEDKPDLKEDHDLATHVLKLHKSQTLTTSPPIEQDLLRKYIAYARREIHPRLSDEAEERLLEYYKELRRSSGKVEEGQLEPIAITPRQLESLVRLAEARAKMRLSNEVTYDDASGAVNLMNATLEKLAKDTETGKLDIDKYASGISARSRRQLDRIDALIDKMLGEVEEDEPVAIKDIIDRAMEEGLNKNQVVKAIDEMTRRGILFEPQQGFVKRP